MERDLERQFLECIEEIDRINEQLSALRQRLSGLIDRLPKVNTTPLKAPKPKIRKTASILEDLSTSPSRYKRRSNGLNLDDFVHALENAGMSVGQQVHQMSHMVGAETGCKVLVNGDVISVFQYEAPLTWLRSENAVANQNLMMFKESEHKDWESILKVFKSL